MRVAYVASGFPFTCITIEAESHRQAGWEVLPCISGPQPTELFSELDRQWRDRSVYRPDKATLARATVREMVTHPLRFLRVILWILQLALHCPTEAAKAVYELGAACYYAALCRRRGIEHIHAHFASRALNLGLMMGFLIGRKVSCTAHAFDLFLRRPASLKFRLAYCAFVAPISQFNKQFLRDRCGPAVADRCEVVYCGIQTDAYTPAKRNPQPGRMLCTSRLVEKKGLDVAIKACAMLRDQGVDFLFQIVSTGPLMAPLQQMVRDYGLEGKVVFLGSLSNEELRQRLNEASLFLMPCIQDSHGDMDGIPMAIMEAMGCGVPSVSTRLSGIPELIEDNVNGRLVPPKDVEALASTLKDLLGNPAKLEAFGQAARRMVEVKFDVNQTAARVRTLIAQANGNGAKV